MKINSQVCLAPTQNAVSRTKNRIRENGPGFVVLSKPKSTQFDRHGQMWILFESVSHNASDGRGGKEAWHGWLPVKEIEVIDETR